MYTPQSYPRLCAFFLLPVMGEKPDPSFKALRAAYAGKGDHACGLQFALASLGVLWLMLSYVVGEQVETLTVQ